VQLGPGEVGVDPSAETAVSACEDVLAAYDRGVAQDAVGGGLEGIGLRLHLEDQIDDVLERQVVGVRPCQLLRHKW
jgi:hypothetical protein